MNKKNVILNILSILIFLSLNNCKTHTKIDSVKKLKNRNPFYTIYIPSGFQFNSSKRIIVSDKNITVNLFAQKFSQGNAVYIEVIPANIEQKIEVEKLIFGRRKYTISKRSWGYRGLFPISPYMRPGNRRVKIKYSLDGDEKTYSFKLYIKKTKFYVAKKELDLGKHSTIKRLSPETIKFIKECKKRKKYAFRRISPDMLSQVHSHPRDMHYITSKFWAKRFYKRYKIVNGKKKYSKSTSSIHRGLDFRGITGTPVYSILDGKTALAKKMYYEGNFIIVDHGNKIFSYFMHMAKLNVKNDDKVLAGDQIGFVGSTGVSTASHLHVSFMINGIQVNPLSILSLPIRN